MNQKDKTDAATSSAAQPIEGPAGIDLHPTPQKSVRLSKLAGLAFIVVGLGLLVAFAYGGYRRQQRDQVAARDAGLPTSVAPATTAGNEFIQAIPVRDAPVPQKTGAAGKLQPPGTYTGAMPPPGQWLNRLRAGGIRGRASHTDLTRKPGSHVRFRSNRIASPSGRHNLPSMPLPRPNPVLRNRNLPRHTSGSVKLWLRRRGFGRAMASPESRSHRLERTVQRTCRRSQL